MSLNYVLIGTGFFGALYSVMFAIGYKLRGPRRRFNVDLTGKVVVITGCSAGVGKESAREIAKTGATIVFACRDEPKTLPIMKTISEESKNKNLTFLKLDLSNLKSVREFSEEFHKRYDRLDILMNNAGIGNTKVILDEEGHDQVFKTNHIGHFLLTTLLLDRIISTKESRVINVSSTGHMSIRKPIDFDDILKGKTGENFNRYAASKYANVLHAQELQRRFEAKNIQSKAVALHPGFVMSEIWYKSQMPKFTYVIIHSLLKIFAPLFINEEQGSWTQTYCALMPYNELIGGGYYQFNKESKCSQYVKKLNQHLEWWEKSEAVTNAKSII